MTFHVDQGLYEVGSDIHVMCNVTGKIPLPETGMFNLTVEGSETVLYPEWIVAKKNDPNFHMKIDDRLTAKMEYNNRNAICQVTDTNHVRVQRPIQLRVYSKCK